MDQAIVLGVSKYGVLVVLSLVAQIDVVLATLLSTVAALVPGLFVGIAAKYVFECLVLGHYSFCYCYLASISWLSSLSSGSTSLSMSPLSSASRSKLPDACVGGVAIVRSWMRHSDQ